ncbi:MAG: YbaB/EbfC family nucleoid-associated protein [Propionibacteriaceae bacterium]|nr:YbaB/EbfC family nucleoid-associated protein [Propionibacteriaceae bacterium]
MTENEPDSMISTNLGNLDLNNLDFGSILSQAQALQSQFQQAQAELSEREITGSAGAGLIEAVVSGAGELKRLTIAAEACDPTDTETLADLIVAAVRDANTRATQVAQATMPQIPGF